MPRMGNRKEVEQSLRVTILVNKAMWADAGCALKEHGLTRGQYIRSCLSRLVGGGSDKEIRYAKKGLEMTGSETEI